MSASESSFMHMNSLFDELGFLVSPQKDIPPCHQMLCLGVWINTLGMTLTVPAFRVAELQPELYTWLNKLKFTKRQLQQLLGKLSYVSAFFWPAQAFMNRFMNALRSCSVSPKHSLHPVTDDLRGDINW